MDDDVQEGHEHSRKHYARRLLLALAIIAALLLWLPTIYVNLATRDARYELSRTAITRVPKRDVAIVLGAALRNRGTKPSQFLRWRIDTAVKLYKAGRVDSLLMSGDGSYSSHDEPEVMRQEALRQGVPPNKIAVDKFGFDTYDSCSRAKTWRGVRSAIVVTQGYHVPRAIYTCRAVGIDTIGVNAQTPVGKGWTPYAIGREWFSTGKLMLQLAQHDLDTRTSNAQ